MGPVPPYYCSTTVCTALYFKGEQILSLLTWVQVLGGCGIALLAVGLLVVLISWIGHLPWLVRLCGVLSLAASNFAWIAVAHIQSTFDDVVQIEQYLQGPPSTIYRLEQQITSALQGALLLSWIVVVVTIVCLLASALGLWRGFFLRDRIRKSSPASLSL